MGNSNLRFIRAEEGEKVEIFIENKFLYSFEYLRSI